MAADFTEIESQQADIIKAIAEGGQYWQVGDKQFRRADLKATWEILQMVSHQNARLTTNNGFGLASFGESS